MRVEITAVRNKETNQETLRLKTPDGEVDGIFLIGALDLLLEACSRNFNMPREDVMKHVEVRRKERLTDMIDEKELN
jgi:hypothetical protein